jgi:hypothetical protein
MCLGVESALDNTVDAVITLPLSGAAVVVAAVAVMERGLPVVAVVLVAGVAVEVDGAPITAFGANKQQIIVTGSRGSNKIA